MRWVFSDVCQSLGDKPVIYIWYIPIKIEYVQLAGGCKRFLYVYPYLGKWSTLTDIFSNGWNHQLVNIYQILMNVSLSYEVHTWVSELIRFSLRFGQTNLASGGGWELLLCRYHGQTLRGGSVLWHRSDTFTPLGNTLQYPDHRCMVYFPTFTIKIRCR